MVIDDIVHEFVVSQKTGDFIEVIDWLIIDNMLHYTYSQTDVIPVFDLSSLNLGIPDNNIFGAAHETSKIINNTIARKDFFDWCINNIDDDDIIDLHFEWEHLN